MYVSTYFFRFAFFLALASCASTWTTARASLQPVGGLAFNTPFVADIDPPLFSPHGGCTAAVVRELSAAKNEILVQAYSFTSQPIADALVAAHKRGVVVRIICDKGQRVRKDSEGPAMIKAGIPTKIDAMHAIAHNKVIVIDGQEVLTGSFNFTDSAENNNAENLIVIRDKAIAKEYADNWHKHDAHSVAWGPVKPAVVKPRHGTTQ